MKPIAPQASKGIAPLAGILTIAGLLVAARPTLAQQYPACQPPSAGEYLLLVVTRSASEQSRVRTVLPSNASPIVCSYYRDVVTRVGGFQDVETATSWANYLNEQVGLQAVVARPSQIATAPNPPSFPTPQPTYGGAYNPQPLGAGYAVIVNYNSQPEIAAQIQQSLNRQIGLVSYGQRPYLLAAHTSDLNIADSVLRSLSTQGFNATVVDSRQVVLLTPAVSLSVGGQ